MLAGFSIVGLLISINYKSGLVWNGGEQIFSHDQLFQNGISQLLTEAIESNAHHWKGKNITNAVI